MAGKVKRKMHKKKSNAHFKPNPAVHNKKDGNSSFNVDGKCENLQCLDKTLSSSRDSGQKNITPSKISINAMMSEVGIAWMKHSNYTPSALSLKGNVTGSWVHFNELDNLDFIKFLANLPTEMDLENWVATCSEEYSRDYLIRNLTEKVEYLTKLAKQWRDCADEIMMQTTKRLNDRKIELRNMRLQKNERESLLKQKVELDSFNSILTEKENYFRMVNRELDRINQAIHKLEALQATNYEVQKSKEALLKAQKWEMEILKMSKETEKQICEVKRQFAEERRKIVELEQKLKLLNEDHEKAKATPSYGR